MSVMYVTKETLEQMRAELHKMKTVERPAASRAIAEAREKGDLKENADYHDTREKMSMMDGEIHRLEHWRLCMNWANGFWHHLEACRFSAHFGLMAMYFGGRLVVSTVLGVGQIHDGVHVFAEIDIVSLPWLVWYQRLVFA